MGRTLDELGATMTMREYFLWRDAYQREPWGEFPLLLSIARDFLPTWFGGSEPPAPASSMASDALQGLI